MSAVDDIAEYLAYLKTGGNCIDQIIFDELLNGEEMTATDELRRMLDEREVEWDELQSHEGGKMTRWRDSTGRFVTAYDEGMVTFFDDFYWQPTPQQAIEATLGRRTTTRHGKFRTKYGRSVPCCECCGYGIGDERWNYCPSCGAEVVEQ